MKGKKNKQKVLNLNGGGPSTAVEITGGYLLPTRSSSARDKPGKYAEEGPARDKTPLLKEAERLADEMKTLEREKMRAYELQRTARQLTAKDLLNNNLPEGLRKHAPSSY